MRTVADLAFKPIVVGNTQVINVIICYYIFQNIEQIYFLVHRYNIEILNNLDKNQPKAKDGKRM